MTVSPRTRAAGWRTVGVEQGALALLSIALVAVVFRVPLWLSNDGPQAVLAGHIDQHYGEPDSVYAKQFSLGLGLSGRGFVWLYQPLASALGWPHALHVAQAVMLLAFAGGVAALSRAVHGRWTYGAVLGFALAFAWPFFMGFYAFYCGIAAGLWVLALAAASPTPSPGRKWILSLLSTLLLAIHPFAAAVIFGLWALVVLDRARRDPDRSVALGSAARWLGLTALPFGLVFLMLFRSQSGLATLKYTETTRWDSFEDWLATIARIALPGGSSLGWLLLAVALVSVALALRRGRRDDGATLPIALGAVLVLALSLLGPLDIPGWQHFARRFLCLGLALAVAVLPTMAQARVAAGATLLSVLAAAVALLSAQRTAERLALACSDALAGLSDVTPRRGLQLPVILDSMCGLPPEPSRADVPYLAPALHLHALFAVRHGGSVPYVFSGAPNVHLLTPKKPPLAPIPPLDMWGLTPERAAVDRPEQRRALLDQFALFGSEYENVLVFGATDADRARLRARGFVSDFSQGSFENAHFVGCRLRVTVPGKQGDPPLMVVGGFDQHTVWPAEFTPVDGGVHAVLRTLCGPVWVQVAWQGSPERCASADEEGRLQRELEPGTNSQIACERR